MKRIRVIALAVASSMLLTACIDDDTYYGFLCALVGGFYIGGGCYSDPYGLTLPIAAGMTTTTPAPRAATSTSQSELYFPQIATGGGYVTAITLMHTDARTPAAPAIGKLTFYNPDGTARVVQTAEMGSASEFDIMIPTGGVRVLTINPSGDVKIGAAKFITTGVSVAGVATFTFGNGVIGALGATPIRSGYIPLTTQTGFSNGVAIQNPGTAPVFLQFTVLNPDGTIEQSSAPPETNPLPINGQFSRFAGAEMGLNKPIKPNSTLQIEVTGSAGTFVALPLVLGNNLYSSAAIISTDIETPVVFPQIADGGGYATVIRLFNPRSVSADAKLRFFNPNGTPRSIGLVGRGAATEFAISMSPKTTLVLETTGTSSTTGVGMARLDSFASIGAAATIFLGQRHVGVPASPRMRSARIPVNTTTGYNTGVAMATGFDSANFKLMLVNRDGAGGQTVQPPDVTPLGTNGQYARYVTEMGFSGASGLADSSLLVESVGDGAFVPLALLDRGASFSTTAAARQTLFSPSDFTGNYSGRWTNSLNTGGPMTLSFNVNTTTNSATGTLSVADEFTPLTFSGSFGPDGFAAALNNQGTFVIKPDGTLSLNSNLYSPTGVAALTLVGYFYRNTASGTFEVVWASGVPSLKGTWTMNKP